MLAPGRDEITVLVTLAPRRTFRDSPPRSRSLSGSRGGFGFDRCWFRIPVRRDDSLPYAATTGRTRFRRTATASRFRPVCPP
jgi:hypothetical protein